MSERKTNSKKAVGGKAPSRLSATLAFDDSITNVAGISAGRAAALAKLGITTVRDLATHYPRRYIDMSAVSTISDARVGKGVTIAGTVYEVELKRPKPRMSLTQITLVDETGTCIVTCFSQPWLVDKLSQGMRIAISGTLEFNFGFKRMTNPFLEIIDGGDAPTGLIVPVHPATEKITTAWMRRLVTAALDHCRGMDDPLPLDLRITYRLMSREAALRAIHFPRLTGEQDQARRRLVYEELLLLELHLMMEARQSAPEGSATAHCVDGKAVQGLNAALPFELTDEQLAAKNDLLHEMAESHQARHMILGDVGTGKTAVAAFALAAAADSGSQALLMAPTEVLAQQHAKTLGPLLESAGVSWDLITGSTSPDRKREIAQALNEGTLQVLMGTHALLEPDIAPVHCTCVIIDEQQRFGVAQRQKLVAKGAAPDVISLTATPIPRSLALALFGDMTQSYLTQRPKNLAGNTTKVFTLSGRGDAYDKALEQLEQGHQVFVVCPLVGQDSATRANAAQKGSHEAGTQVGQADDFEFSVISIEDDDDMGQADPKAAEQHARILQDTTFSHYKVAVLHGRMSAEEKQRVMQDFREGKADVLVATTVIEVGVDVPNATVMIVEDADRFGLSQLHQLRGRVGRGESAGYVCLISASKVPAALERLAAMEKTEDGFKLAEYDLSLRREGDILGNRQHGSSILKLVNVVRDAAVIKAAHHDAHALLHEDADLSANNHRALAHEVQVLFKHNKAGDLR